ncbi:UDP-N-acetylglucosamine 2-epimerase [Thiovulum sp. ES]|nr:UDP-N-acetylglucosamine 2-epimerase [Thiovulum sp. ES]
MKKNILVVFGTRPEAIKMAIVVKQLQKVEEFNTKVCVTAQHREMLDQVLEIFNIVPDYDLDIMSKNQDLFDVTIKIMSGIKEILNSFNPDLVIVHGDTSTSTISALSSFYKQIDVAHIEAGLRTFNIYSPFPEEANRQITRVLAKYHFAPTQSSKNNLIKEGVEEKNILVSGNSVIDSLIHITNKINKNKNIKEAIEKLLIKFELNLEKIYNKKIILVTGHRRENFGDSFLNICNAIKEIAIKNRDVEIVYPVHLNPNVRKPVNDILRNIENVNLIEPLDYEPFIYLMNKSYLILTDSGGIQEEAPSLGKPVLVMRDTTERPEAVDSGTVKLVGTNKEIIIAETEKLLNNKAEYNKMSKAHNPYGDGKASEKIVEFLKGTYEI